MKRAKMLLLFIGLMLVIGFFSFLGLEDIFSIILTSNPVMLFLAFFTQVSIILVLSLRMSIIINTQGGLELKKGGWSSGTHRGFSFLDVIKVVVIGMAVNFVTPIAKLGGEPAKIYMLKRKNIKATTSTAIVAVDSFAEFSTYYLLIFPIILLMLIAGVLPFAKLLPFLILLLISSLLLCGFLFLCFNYKMLRRITEWTIRKISMLVNKFSKTSIDLKKDYAKMFHTAFGILMNEKKLMIKTYSLSFLLRILEFLRIYFIFNAFSYEISFSTIIFAWALTLLIGMVPWLPGGLGLVEAGGTYAFMLLGVMKSIAGAVIFVDRIICFWLVLVIGMCIVWIKKIKI